jgi:hypothetical protein
MVFLITERKEQTGWWREPDGIDELVHYAIISEWV